MSVGLFTFAPFLFPWLVRRRFLRLGRSRSILFLILLSVFILVSITVFFLFFVFVFVFVLVLVLIFVFLFFFYFMFLYWSSEEISKISLWFDGRLRLLLNRLLAVLPVLPVLLLSVLLLLPPLVVLVPSLLFPIFTPTFVLVFLTTFSLKKNQTFRRREKRMSFLSTLLALELSFSASFAVADSLILPPPFSNFRRNSSLLDCIVILPERIIHQRSFL